MLQQNSITSELYSDTEIIFGNDLFSLHLAVQLVCIKKISVYVITCRDMMEDLLAQILTYSSITCADKEFIHSHLTITKTKADHSLLSVNYLFPPAPNLHNQVNIWFIDNFSFHNEYISQAQIDTSDFMLQACMQIISELDINKIIFHSNAYIHRESGSQILNPFANKIKTHLEMIDHNRKTSKLISYYCSHIADPLDDNDNLISLLLDDIYFVLMYIRDRSEDFFNSHRLKILFTEIEKINIIPVFGIIQKMISISNETDEDLSSYFFQNSNAFSSEKFYSILAAILQPEYKVEITNSLDELNLLDKLLLNRSGHYIPWLNARIYQTSTTREIDIIFSTDDLIEFFKAFFHKKKLNNSGLDSDSIERISNIKKNSFYCRYGQFFPYYIFGEGPALVILSALGVDLAIWYDVIVHFSKKYKILIWDARGMEESLYAKLSEGSYYAYDERMEDIYEVLIRENIDECHLIGWCSGTKEALYFTERYPQIVKSLILIAGDFTDAADRKTPLIDDIKKMSDVITKSPRMPELFVKTLAKNPKININSPHLDNHVCEKIIHYTNPKHFNLILGKILNKNQLIGYCRRVYGDIAFDCAGYVADIKNPTLIISAENDSVSNPAQSCWLRDEIEQAQFIEIPGAEHYLPIENSREIISICDVFLSN